MISQENHDSWCLLHTTIPSDPAQKHLDGGGKNHFLSLFLAASEARAEILEKHYRAGANLDKVINVEWSLPSLISQGAVGKYGMDTYHIVAK